MLRSECMSASAVYQLVRTPASWISGLFTHI